MIEYTVQIDDGGAIHWYLKGNRHRVDGPAVEYPDGTKYWYLNGKKLTESKWKQTVKPKSKITNCSGKIIEVDGKKYKLISV